jgi:arylsulfatase A-like enzyme
MGRPVDRRAFLKLLSLSPLLATRGSRRSVGAANGQGPNILVILFDTLTARHVSLYGYPRETMPNLARFASRATVFHNHHSAGNFTTPSTGSFFTGTYPWTHRALSHQATVRNEFLEKNIFHEFQKMGYTTSGFSHNYLVNLLLHHLRENLDQYTLPEDIARAEYNFSDDLFYNDYVTASRMERSYLKKPGKFSNSFFIFPIFWLLKTFDERRVLRELVGEFPRGVPGYHDMLYPLNETIDWIKQLLASLPHPFFSYIHMMPPHDPYSPGREFVNIFWDGYTPVSKPPHVFGEGQPQWFLNQQRAVYDEYIAYVDSEFGRLYDYMEQEGILDNTWVVFTSDHGELFEREIWQHTTRVLYESIIHVPLVISRPGQTKREDVFDLTSTVDLLPTLLHLAGGAVPDWAAGEILPTIGSEARNTERSVFVVEGKSNPKTAPIIKATVAMITGRYKAIKYIGYDKLRGRVEVYDLENDPEELNDLTKAGQPIAADLADALNREVEKANEPFKR